MRLAMELMIWRWSSVGRGGGRDLGGGAIEVSDRTRGEEEVSCGQFEDVRRGLEEISGEGWR